jgi:flagellin FlaB
MRHRPTHLQLVLGNEEGITGLETAIVLIAFVVVASVFAFAVLSTGLLSAEKSKETVLGGLSEAGSTLFVKGVVVGKANSGLTNIDTLTFLVSVASQANQGVDLSSTNLILGYVSGVESSNLAASAWTTSWLIGSGPLVDPGETVEIVADLTGLTYPPSRGEGFTLSLTASEGGVVRIRKAAPSELKAVMQLGDAPTAAIALSLDASEDSYVSAGSSTTNYGTTTAMTTGTYFIDNERSFVNFDISAIPASFTVQSATLTLCATTTPAVSRTYNATRVTAAWVESTVTWNLQPAVAGSATDTAASATGCLTWTVTDDVQTWVNGTTANGFRISDATESGITQYTSDFRTREDTTEATEVPNLAVTYLVP